MPISHLRPRSETAGIGADIGSTLRSTRYTQRRGFACPPIGKRIRWGAAGQAGSARSVFPPSSLEYSGSKVMVLYLVERLDKQDEYDLVQMLEPENEATLPTVKSGGEADEDMCALYLRTAAPFGTTATGSGATAVLRTTGTGARDRSARGHAGPGALTVEDWPRTWDGPDHDVRAYGPCGRRPGLVGSTGRKRAGRGGPKPAPG